MKYGYHGKILHVNLTDGICTEETLDTVDYRKYTGGPILGATQLLKNTPAGLDAFDESAALLFLTGIMSGFNAPGLARFVICGKSPQTGGIGEARCEGPFAVALKKTGYDGLMIKGACETPSLLVIEDGKAKIEEAPSLWGATVSKARQKLDRMYPGADTALIGPAGENKVRYANVIASGNHQASRAGMGAVMGSKKLKGLVIRGGELPAVYAPGELKKIKEWFTEQIATNDLATWQHSIPGFAAWIDTHGTDASLCVNNYQTSKCDYTESYSTDEFMKYYKGLAACPGCTMNCIKRFAAPGDHAEMGGLHQEALGAFGPNLGNSSLKKIIQANSLCNEYGLDPTSLGFSISFAQECVQNDLLDSEGLNLDFSEKVDLLPLIEKIVKREGIGDLLAEGSWRAAQKIGNGAERYSMSVKGNELTSTEGRTQTNLALGFATAPVGPRYDICEHDWDFDTEMGWDHSLNYTKTLGIVERIPMQHLGKDKVRNYKALSELWSATEALGLCMFSTAPTRVYSLEKMTELYHHITGFEVSSYEIMRLGHVRHQLYRLYNVREGLTAEQDTLPDRFFDRTIDTGSMKGTKLDRKKFEEMTALYYQMMGWDEKGVPTEAVLYDLGIEWAKELS